MSSCDLENEVKVTKIQSALKIVIMVHLCEFEENPSTGSRDILHTDYDLENGVKVTKTLMCLKPVIMIYPLKSDEYPSICSRNISILAIKLTFVGWVLTLKIRGHCHQNIISSLNCPKAKNTGMVEIKQKG